MSYDLRFAVKVAGREDLFAVIGEPEYASPTYNIGTMLRKCMDWDFHQGEWYRLIEVLPKIEQGIHELRFHEEKYIPYNSPNGWGTTDSAKKALESIMRWLTEDGLPWSWNGDIPLDCLYISW